MFDFIQALTKAVGEANGGGKNMSQAENVARVYVDLAKTTPSSVCADKSGLAGMQLERS